MISERNNLRNADSIVNGLMLSSIVPCNLKMTGYIKDVIKYGDGREEVREGHNLVVTSFLNLVQALLKNETGYSGIQYWAVGSGDEAWDSSLPQPASTEVKLVAEIGRVAISPTEITFRTPGYEESPTPTNIIQITHTFGTDDCNGVWREFGIFGGNATTAADSGIMINKRNHAIITKTTDMTVERTMRFTLTLG